MKAEGFPQPGTPGLQRIADVLPGTMAAARRTKRNAAKRLVPPLTREQASALMRALSRSASPVARLVARRLIDLDHGDGAYPGYERLAEYVGASSGSIRNALGELHRLGALVSGRRPGLGNLRAYFLVPFDSWSSHVMRAGDTESVSPATVTPAQPPALLVSPSALPPVSPSVSPETVHSIEQVGSEEREIGSRDPRTAGASLGARPVGGNGAQPRRLSARLTRAEAEAAIAYLDQQAAVAQNEVERDFLRKTARLKRRQLDAPPAPELAT